MAIYRVSTQFEWSGHHYLLGDLVEDDHVAYVTFPERFTSITADIEGDAGWPSGAETSIPRYSIVASAVTMSTGSLRLAYFTAKSATARTTMTAFSGSTAAGATPTLVRFGIYSVAANGDLTLVRSTTSNTAIFAGANTAYAEALDASWTPTVGARYAAGVLVVTGATAPTVHGVGLGSVAAIAAGAPKLAAVFASQTDLPSSITNAQAAASVSCVYAEVS